MCIYTPDMVLADNMRMSESSQKGVLLVNLICIVADLCHVVLSCFRGEKASRENPPNGDLFVFSHGDLLPRHTKVRHFSRLFASCLSYLCLAGERSPRENPPKSPFIVFSRVNLSPRQAKIRQTGAKTRKVATRKPAKW